MVFNGCFFCLIILALSLCRLWRRTFCPVPVRCPRDGGMLQAPLCPPPRPVPRKNKCAPRRSHKKEPKERQPVPCSSSADAMKEGVWRNSGSSTLAPSSSASTLRPSFRSLCSQSSHSDTSLPTSSLAGTSLPTSVVERKSSTAWVVLNGGSVLREPEIAGTGGASL